MPEVPQQVAGVRSFYFLMPEKIEIKHKMEVVCRFWTMLVDVICICAGLALAYYLRFHWLDRLLPDGSLTEPSQVVAFNDYKGRIFFATLLLFGLILSFGGYNARTLLRFRRSFPIIAKALFTWLLAFPSLSLILGLDESLSRIFVVLSFLCLFLTVLLGRLIIQRFLNYLGVTRTLRQRIIFVDWTEKAAVIANAIIKDRWHPYELVGCAPPAGERFTTMPPPEIPTLGSHGEVKTLCEKHLVDLVILADGRRRDGNLLELARQCERCMVGFMVIPSGFQILLSGLGLTTISSVPLLGVTELPLDNPVNAALKRIMDVVGAVFGLILSVPIIAIFGLLVYLESPGPIFHTQVRVGRKGRHFKIIKIRSMKLDAEKGSEVGWSTKEDNRRLKIGVLMRKTNIDEVPQFWNVLMGDLSLVGPRPERPELIQKFRDEIPFYNARHNIIPGISGWAQVNGFRGDTDLNERIRCDIYYIENWSLILDLQIMFMTFFRWEGAH